MAIKTGNRYQTTYLPQAIEDYVEKDDPVRVYDAFIDALNQKELGLLINRRQVGNSTYDPISMLKLLVYGYSYGWRSSRKLERALYHNMSFVWLVGGLKPDHKTIANFRKDNKVTVKNVMKQCARMCIKLGFIAGNTLFLDGTKVRASASISQTKTHEKWEKQLEKIEHRIETLLDECENIDQTESGDLVRVNKELAQIETRKAKIEKALDQMKREDRKKINATDPDAVNLKGRQGSHAGYNPQVVTDEKNGLIVSTDVVNETNDLNQFTNQVEQANKVLEKPCQVACADAGYAKVDNLKETVDKEIDVIVPSQRQSLHKAKENKFSKESFTYDKSQNCYTCPEGKILNYSHYDKSKNQYLYRFKGASPCHDCQHYGKCTKAKRGRAITRLVNQELKETLEKKYESEIGQAIYKKRKEKVEAVFGHIKRNINGGYFLVRGLESVKAEFSIFGTCYNVARMITLAGGVCQLVKKLKALPV